MILNYFSKKITNYLKSYNYIHLSIIFALALFFFFPVIFHNKTFYAFDCLLQNLPWAIESDFCPNNLLITDPIQAIYSSLFYPAHHYFQESLSNGIFPLWFGLSFCGIPHYPYSSPFFYILNSIFSVTVAHDLLLFIHLFAIGVFTFLYLREIGLKKISAMTGSIAWMFNGYVMVWFEFEHIPMMAATLSGTLYFIELWWKSKSPISFLCLICSIALSICVTYAHVLIYQLIFIGSYILYYCISDKLSYKTALKYSLKKLIIPILAIAISFCISANFFTTHLMMIKNSHRKAIPYSELFKKTGKLPSKYLSTLLFPDVFGSPAREVSFPPRTDHTIIYSNYNEFCIYPGIITLFLALCCFPYFGKKKYISFFILTGLYCLFSAMGCIIYYPLGAFIPGLNMSTPTRILYIFGFSISILSAIGSDIILKKNNLSIVILWTIIPITALSIFFFIQTETGLMWLTNSVQWENQTRVKALQTCFDLSNVIRLEWNDWNRIVEMLRPYLAISSDIILKPLLIIFSTFFTLICVLFSSTERQKKILLSALIILLAYDLISFGKIYNTASDINLEYPSTPAIEFLKKDKSIYRIMTFGPFMQNSFSKFGIEDIGGYTSVLPPRYGEFIYLSQFGSNSSPPKINKSVSIIFNKFGSPLLDLINTKYLLFPPNINPALKQLKLVYKGEINIYENLNVFPRMFIVPGYQLATSKQETYKLLGKYSRNDFINKVILESQPEAHFIIDDKISYTEMKSSINLISYSPNRIKIKTSSKYNGFLIISDNYHPGWKAVIDGKPSEILQANYIMRAIPIKAGKHNVILEFKPVIMITGWIITIIGWSLLIIIIGIFVIKKILLSIMLPKNWTTG
ncbi:Bacterial membrane protein YfhO domain-containing protein [Desulfonema limicola]|uniref:Bacterial membrane protein YfhO domain-containing protein n=1 Tax=Desulfonema limicola TaxID=45656 RepID=A0A975BAL0_9BACT|nr:YfhO family protein [Desulfonema limicola]QTA81893.1 Bacterial membrane protein YfhO domain-containing protein [Desulfonema limicola]